ncbi:hypothetical protein BU25DRAFT_494919 [Macroventuria anomochaeta]|uniref:Uncharacterized protein n=1 Tax=Macroventuria anomochaeta TaxID=301207 RepID=A0ACB6RMH0_9PLEO|nr:uncharacterized protein BU25DRAFT_494919 [Macroventuria anomochaeta]KAF2622600.1 hypothetical protein BU25DRAFT_494919 [Macroventuria anomochaeta]
MAIMRISTKVHSIITSAASGHYAHPFFEAIDPQRAVHSGKNIRRFRAVVQDLNNEFAEDMRLFGHTYSIENADEAVVWSEDAKSEASFEASDGGSDEEPDVGSEEPLDGDSKLKGLAVREASVETTRGRGPRPQHLTFEEGVSWVKNAIVRCRGRELPSSVNLEVTSHLFWEQSAPWKVTAKEHISRIQDMCREFVDQVLEYAVPKEFKKPLEKISTTAVLEQSLQDAQEEFQKLLKDKEQHRSSAHSY